MYMYFRFGWIETNRNLQKSCLLPCDNDTTSIFRNMYVYFSLEVRVWLAVFAKTHAYKQNRIEILIRVLSYSSDSNKRVLVALLWYVDAGKHILVAGASSWRSSFRAYVIRVTNSRPLDMVPRKHAPLWDYIVFWRRK
jgi:hypothetical protein